MRNGVALVQCALRNPEPRMSLRVIRVISGTSAERPVTLRNSPRKRTFQIGSSVPCVDGSELARKIFTSQRWSVQPCVRPTCAVHMTASHNVLRGSGPRHKPAFDNALAQVGCPDRRIDRLCITCCSPSQPSHHAGCPTRSHLRRKRDGLPITLAPGHHGPGHSGDLVGKRDGRQPSSAAVPAMP